MLIHPTQYFLMIMVVIVYYIVLCSPTKQIYKEFSYAGTKYRFYLESSGRKCFWNGEAPFCFLSSSCPTRTTTMKSDKSGDGGYCWIGFKYYCCLELPNL